MRTLSASLFEKRTRGFPFLLGVLVSVAPSFAAEGPAKSKLEDHLKQLQYDAIPFKMHEGNKPVIKGELGNGKKTVFLMDTGWGMTTLNTKTAAQLKTLGQLGVEIEDSMMGRLTNPAIVLVEDLKLGRARFLNQPARVEKLRMDFLSLAYEGILGCDFFCRNFCLIDCIAGRLYVRASKRSAQQSEVLETSLRRSGYVEVPARPKLPLIIGAKANEKPVNLLVDTGGFVSVLDDSQVARLSLRFVKDQRRDMIPDDLGGRMIGMGKIGAHEFRVTKLKTFEVGSREWRNTSFGVGSLKSWRLEEAAAPEEDLHGILGMDLLVSHEALIDFSSLKVWLRPESKSPAKK